MDLLCINDLFSIDTLEFYEKHGVFTPVRDITYTLRDVIINSNGQTGVLLEELVNPKVPFHHPMGFIASAEPNWHISRFSHLNGEIVETMELKQFIKQTSKIT